MTESVLIVGVGSGLSASLARLCSSKGMKVVLAARDIEKLQDKFTKEFENLANKILDEKSEKFTKKNKENNAS